MTISPYSICSRISSLFAEISVRPSFRPGSRAGVTEGKKESVLDKTVFCFSLFCISIFICVGFSGDGFSVDGFPVVGKSNNGRTKKGPSGELSVIGVSIESAGTPNTSHTAGSLAASTVVGLSDNGSASATTSVLSASSGPLVWSGAASPASDSISICSSSGSSVGSVSSKASFGVGSRFTGASWMMYSLVENLPRSSVV